MSLLHVMNIRSTISAVEHFSLQQYSKATQLAMYLHIAATS